MTILTKPLRRQLETAIKQAREIAEDAAKEAIERIGVAEAEASAHLSDTNKALRRRLRAHARTLGDTRGATGAMATARLQDEASYEIWHRMLFGRFLAERGLLIHPDIGAAMSVAELRELAKEEGASDEWALAERYAAPGLPGVFKPDDPVVALPIAPEFSKRLRGVLGGLPLEVFTAEDSLGWTYQFWRASEKDAVNAAGVKIGAAELPAVTQLFTESYMVKFLLHNTLGAWWAGKILAGDPDLARDAADENALREACAIPGVTWEFLRFIREGDGKGLWRPAAGNFTGWPTRAREITYCDPCCGSGHFLVEAFTILAALRQCEEGLLAADAAIGVLKDNLHGLEIDGRCVQIAAFNVALAAWGLAGKPIVLPSPHIAWVGASAPMARAEMAALAEGDLSLTRAFERLHDQFKQASVLGSLLEAGAQDLLDVDLRLRGAAALEKLRRAGPEQAEGAFAAKGLLDATALLAQKYTLFATNVPFLGRAKQIPQLADFIEKNFDDAKADLATAMIERMLAMTAIGGTIASVTPQNWLFLGGYKSLREKLLNSVRLTVVAGLGPRAFETISGEIVNAALVVIENSLPDRGTEMFAIDANTGKDFNEKEDLLKNGSVLMLKQDSQKKNPDQRISVQSISQTNSLSEFAHAYQGITSGDNDRYRRVFWERPLPRAGWALFQSTVEKVEDFGGRHLALWWGAGGEHIARPQGMAAWGKPGVAVSQMGAIAATIATGAKFDMNASVLVPRDPANLPAVWAYCSSPEFLKSVRRIDQSVKVTTGTLTKVPFDVAQWKSVAASKFPAGLPEPYSDDPTQWLFHGHPAFSAAGTELHVALARIAGYRWPGEADTTMRLSDLAKSRIALAGALHGADAVGLLPLHANGADHSLADRLRDLLSAAYGQPLLPSREQALVRAADARLEKKEGRDTTLEGWLADRAFRQHCILFHQRPFLWQVWDGMNAGFSAFLNYHRLDRAVLEKLTYTLLGDWIRTAKAEGNTARLERAEQLQQKFAKIIEGESPYDIFVRWKSLAKQPLGWEPDLDDGVRLNIRPFITAGVLRDQPKGISWNKDRGTDVPSAPWYDLGPRNGGNLGDRINDHHTSLAEKRAARGTS
jgi:hypothetical protein